MCIVAHAVVTQLKSMFGDTLSITFNANSKCLTLWFDSSVMHSWMNVLTLLLSMISQLHYRYVISFLSLHHHYKLICRMPITCSTCPVSACAILLPFILSLPHLVLYLLVPFFLSYLIHRFSCLFIPSHSARIVPLHFQAIWRRR